jgi:cytochrome c oxidase subunit IV
MKTPSISFFKEFLNINEINKLAKETGFIVRVRKITGFYFLMSVMLYLGDFITLRGLSESSFYDEDITRGAIAHKFTKNSVNFVEKVFYSVLDQKLHLTKISTKQFEHFKDILLVDSSNIFLKDSLNKIFPGAGGKKNSSSVKVQLLYSYLNSKISFIELTNGNIPDQKYIINLLSLVNKKELFIGDLAYMVFNFLYLLNEKGAYFLGRHNLSRVLYYKTKMTKKNGIEVEIFKKFDINKHKEELQKNVTEKFLYIKKKNKYIRVRVIFFKTPESIANKRRRDLNKKAKNNNKSKKANKKRLSLLDWSIFITNTSSEQLDYKMIRNIYRIRWNIELIFKNWKSILKINKSTVTKNEYRVKFELYAKLIFAMIIQKIYQRASSLLWLKNKELSLFKMTDLFVRKRHELQISLLISIDKFASTMRRITQKAIKTCIKEYQKSRKTTLQIIDLAIEEYR